MRKLITSPAAEICWIAKPLGVPSHQFELGAVNSSKRSLDNNCHHRCEAGAKRTVRCETESGAQGCTIETCDVAVTECPDGVTLACNMPCP